MHIPGSSHSKIRNITLQKEKSSSEKEQKFGELFDDCMHAALLPPDVWPLPLPGLDADISSNSKSKCNIDKHTQISFGIFGSCSGISSRTFAHAILPRKAAVRGQRLATSLVVAIIPCQWPHVGAFTMVVLFVVVVVEPKKLIPFESVSRAHIWQPQSCLC